MAVATTLLVAATATGQQLLPQARYSTHDWTMPVGGEQGDYNEYWVDTKTPGDGRTYTVGTIQVRNGTNSAMFSNSPIQPADGPGFLRGLAQPPRQVVALQVADAGQGIQWQRFFFGEAFNELASGATNARGISVWAEPDPEDTRIAICGETFDATLPLSQAPAGNPLAGSGVTSGFIAVFNGTGTLLWTHHFFGNQPGQSCAITDVTVRVYRDDKTAERRDVVTYCGITSHGNPLNGNAWLTTLLEFDPPTVITGCSNPSGGNSNNGPGQWDGLVGRLSHEHENPVQGGQTLEFQSIVGGGWQDGLFGIADMSATDFLVVGSTATSAIAAQSTFTFPLRTATCLSPNPNPLNYCIGSVMHFRYDPSEPPTQGRPAPVLTLVAARDVGRVGESWRTILRDVVVTPGIDSGVWSFAAVGSTSDPAALTTWESTGALPPDSTLDGLSDGLVLWGYCGPTIGIVELHASFRGGPGIDGLTGVQAWSEYVDHFSVVGFTDAGGNGINLTVGNYYFRNDGSAGLVALTGGQLGGAMADIPTATGPANATSIPIPAYSNFGLGNPAGGGVAVDSAGRVTVVGSTESQLAAPFPVVGFGARLRVGTFADAVRTSLELLPVGTGRTDGFGTQVAPPAGPYPIAGTTGGTTPACALSPFGVRIGEPAPALRRMLIDFEDNVVSGTRQTAIVVVRPTAGASFNLTALQFGFPNQPGFPPALLPDGLELWTTNAPVTFPVGPFTTGPLRFALFAPSPAGPLTFTAQLVCFQPGATIPGGIGPICTSMTANSASPALWVIY